MFGNMKLINITIKGGVIVKKELKGFAIGLIVTTLLISTVLAGGVKQTIEVVLNSVNLTVNGKKVEADNILYKEATYVPIKAIAEALGKDVVWDSKTNTINVNDKQANNNVQTTANGFVFSMKYTTKVSSGWTYTTSEITNNSGKDCSMVQIEATYYGSDGTVLGKGTAYVYDIKKGQTKSFETMENGDFSNATNVKFQTNYVQN